MNDRELVRYASLAASSHNTQPWKFKIDDGSISILPDFTRRCPIVDPDDHHLFVSLGCAAENLLVAAEAGGFRGQPVFDELRVGGTVRIAFEKDPTAPLVVVRGHQPAAVHPCGIQRSRRINGRSESIGLAHSAANAHGSSSTGISLSALIDTLRL
jgi:hypothetical protein